MTNCKGEVELLLYVARLPGALVDSSKLLNKLPLTIARKMLRERYGEYVY